MMAKSGCRSLKSGAGELARAFDVVCGAAADQRVVVPDRLGLAEEIALHRVAALVRQEAELFLGLPALGDDRHFEAVAEIDDGANDRRRLRVAPEIHDEGAVDLD